MRKIQGLPSVTPLKVEKASFKELSSIPGDRPGTKAFKRLHKRDQIKAST